MNYPPTVKINGQILECEFTPAGNAVILDGVVITWGRENLYEPTSPSECTLTLLDPVGDFASDPALFGAELIVETSVNMLFKGRIDDISITPDQVGSGATTAGSDPNMDVWRVDLRATDILATLAKLNPAGLEGGLPNYRQAFGPGYWNEGTPESRRADLQTRIRSLGYSNVILETRDLAVAVPPGKNWQTYYRTPAREAGDTLYDLIQDVQSRGDEIFHTSYVPAQDRITIGRFPQAASLVLTYVGSVIGLANEGAAGGSGNVVDCRKIAIDGEGALSANVTHNIAAMDVDQFNQTQKQVPLGTNPETYGWTLDYKAIVWSAAIANPAGGSARYHPPSMVVSVYNWASSVWSEGAPEVIATIGPWLSALNGKLMPPKFVFDLENETFDQQVINGLLKTWTSSNSGQTPRSWSFPGSIYETLNGWGPVFQQIGATLDFHQGWEVTSTFAPARVTVGNLTISQLVTTDPPTFDQYADIISLSTLGTVTRGI